jgi:platelet-activating factor acetylhydrolase IB subunit alpha
VVGSFVATGSRDKSIKLWDATNGQCLATFVRYLCSCPPVCCIVLTLASRFLLYLLRLVVSRSYLNSTPYFIADSSKFIDDNWVRALLFHPSGKYLLSSSDDKTIKTWDLVSGRCIKTLEAHNHFVTCMTWGRIPLSITTTTTNGNGVATNGTIVEEARVVNVLASASVDFEIKIWLP